MRLAARAAAAPDHPAWADPRFVRWLATRTPREDPDALGALTLARGFCRKLSIARLDAVPVPAAGNTPRTIRVSAPLDATPPFIHVGDELVLEPDGHRRAPRAVVSFTSAGLLVVVTDVPVAGSAGVIVGLYCPHL